MAESTDPTMRADMPCFEEHDYDGPGRRCVRPKGHPAPAELTDAQVDAWLSDRGQVRITAEMAKWFGLPL